MSKRLKRDLFIYAGLLLLGLIMAFWVSLPVDSENQKFVEWFKLPKVQVASLSLEGKELGSITIKRSVADESFVGLIKKPGLPDRSFVSNEKSAEIFAALDPFYVHRRIGKLDDVKKSEYGIRAESNVSRF